MPKTTTRKAKKPKPRVLLTAEAAVKPVSDYTIPAVRTQLNESLSEAIADLTREGFPGDAMCDYLGITYAAFASWIRRGKAYVEGGEEPKEHKAYGDFYQAYRRAWAEYRLQLSLDLHSKFAGKDWIRLMTILERRDRRNYGKRELPASNLNSIDPNERFL